MIDYVDRLLQHWAQEFSVRDHGVNLGYARGWSVGAISEAEGDPDAPVTARGTATRPTSARTGVSKVAERVNQSVERLPPHLEKAIKLHYVERPEYKVYLKAQILGVSSSTFNRVIHKAHEQLSADLPDTYVNWSLSVHRP